MQLLWFVIIGVAAGWLSGQLTKGRGFGLLGDLAVGAVGAILGGMLFGSLGLNLGSGLIGSLITATIGALLLLFVGRQIRRTA
jgi:uncharacterized membrane protein YeaQ/YmgE (transglycosylase-associated protein family)